MDKTLCQPDTYDLSEDEVLALITAERVRVKKPNGMCPLHYAAHYTTSKAVVDAIIAEYPEALQAKNNFGETPGDTAQSHSKSADVKAVFASADRDGGAGSKARKERRDSGSSTGSLSDRGRLGRRGSVGDQAVAHAINSSRSSFAGGSRRWSFDSQLAQLSEEGEKIGYEGATAISRVKLLEIELADALSKIASLEAKFASLEAKVNGAA
mmetsp:Transcript_20261/g.65253  ORF Transcript_20261/g.65253 Transcript_20261/m.65253 type:complete len:211 (-) Transcript_20261:42-674(-)